MSEYDDLMGMAVKAHNAGRPDHARQLVQMAIQAEKAQNRAQADMSFMGRVKDNVFGVDDGVQSFGEGASRFLNKAGEAMTFGVVGDEADAFAKSKLRGSDYQDELSRVRAQEQEFVDTTPGLATAAEIGGGVAGAVLPVGAAFKGAKAASMGANALKSAGLGMTGGATYGFMEGEDPQSRKDKAVTGAAIGAAGGAAAPAVGKAVQNVANAVMRRGPMRKAVQTAKTAAETRKASSQQYDAFADADAQISPAAMGRMKRAVVDKLSKEGKSHLPGTDGLNPGADRLQRIVTEMDDQVQVSNSATPLKSIDDFRQVAGDVAQDVNSIGRATKDARLGTITVDEVDNFVDSLGPEDIVSGDVHGARDALLKARDLWRHAQKTQMIENVLDSQDDYLGGPASAIRNKVATLLRNPKTRNKFSDAEQTYLRKIIGGNPVTRAIRLAGNGIGRQAQMALGGAGAGPLGTLAGAMTGEITAEAANRHAVKQAELAHALIASGGLENLPSVSPEVRRIAESLMRRQIGANAHQLTPTRSGPR